MRAAIEILLWVAVITLVTSLAGCDERENQPGAQQECVLTSQGDVCRTPDGIERK